jgi:type IV fimbrial biogenesis protein FimT
MLPQNGICSRSPLSSCGFTVIEFAVTLVMLAVGLLLAFPSLQTLSANNQLVAASNSIVSGMNLARASAVTLGEDVTICPSRDSVACTEDSWNGGWIVFNDADADGAPDTAEIIRTVVLDGRVEGSGYGEGIVFRSDGTTSMDADAVITNCYVDPDVTGDCLDVTVSAFGLIQSTRHSSSPEPESEPT